MTVTRKALGHSAQALVVAYDCALLDLDGVVYLSDRAVEGAPHVLARARDLGMTLAFVTNNASRTPDAVAKRLTSLGVPVGAADVVTSAQAAASALAERLPDGAAVLVVGGQGLREALEQRGLRPVTSAEDGPVAVVQGFDRSIGWRDLAEGAVVARSGALWVASNLDLTVPTSRGPAPGNGTLVNAVAEAAGRRPDVVAGKPFGPLFEETARRVSPRRPLVVGDRLDTDIEGAVAWGADSLLVMTGVTDVATLCQAPPHQRPTYVAWTLAGLLTAHSAPQLSGGAWMLNGWSASVDRGRLRVGARGDDDSDGLRVVAAACWDVADHQGGGQVDVDELARLWPDHRALPASRSAGTRGH